jgi:hypothetical protein
LSDVPTARRYYLLKRLAARAAGEPLEHTWRTLQEAQPGTVLPTDFPSRTALEDSGYSTAEDIDGADTTELREEVGINETQANAVIAAAAALI